MGVPVVPLLGFAGQLIEKLFPDPAERAKAQERLERLQLDGDLKKIELQLSAIVMEAQSQDKWTSRARPSFMYVIYTYVLAAIPFGAMFAINPEIANAVTAGVASWLASIPGEMWGLFGAGYLGYTGARSYEKKKIIER